MKIAIKQALKSLESNDVPIACVIVKDGKIISKAYNQVEKRKKTSYHAEIIAIEKAQKKLKTKFLTDCSLYSTLEPCSMCAGAIILARIPLVVIGTADPKTGACGTVLNLHNNSKLNHKFETIFDVEKDICSQMLKDFFSNLREIKKKEKNGN